MKGLIELNDLFLLENVVLLMLLMVLKQTVISVLVLHLDMS